MSDLRKQLRGLQDDYKSQKYPGDLAADVLGSASARSAPAGGGWMKIAVGMAAAVTMAGMVWVGLDRGPTVEVASNDPVVETDPGLRPDVEADVLVEQTLDAVPTLIAAKPAEAGSVERPTWSTLHDESERPGFGSIGSVGGMALQYHAASLPSFSEVQSIRDEQEQSNEQTAG